MAEIDKIETTDNGSTPNQENSCPSSSSETSIAPSTSDEKIEKKVTSCSDDSDEPQAIVATAIDVNSKTSNDPMDEKSYIEMESQQLPSSSTEETNGISGTDNETMARDDADDVGESLTDTVRAVDSKKKDTEDETHTVDCAADSSGVINKCDLMTTNDVLIADEATPSTLMESALEESTTAVEADSIPQPEIESNTKAEVKVEEVVQVEMKNEIEIEIETETEHQPEPQIQPLTQSEPERKEETKPKPEPQPQPQCEQAEPKNDSTHDIDENVKSIADATTSVIDICDASSSSSKSDTKCVEKQEIEEEQHCDSVESATENDVEQISNVQNDENIVLRINSGATTEQLDSEIEQIEHKNGSVDEENATENGSNDCDSSDILVENKVESEENGAICANYACESDEKINNEATDKCEPNTTKNVAEPSVVNSSEECKQNEIAEIEKEREKEQEQKEPIQIDVQNEQLPSALNTEENDVQTQMDIDPETAVKEANEQTTLNVAGTKQNCDDLVPSESTPSNETKCAYDLNECVSSPEMAPKGFKDKFKKSFEIMEKSKQESNLIDKHEKITDQTRTKTSADYKICASIVVDDDDDQTNASLDKDIESSNRVIRNEKNDSKSSSTNKISATSNDVCDLTQDCKRPKIVETNYERTTNCNSIKETIISPENAVMPSKSITHSTRDGSQQQRTQHDDSQDREIKPPAATTETRTIIISPQNKGRLDLIKGKHDEPKPLFNADSLTSSKATDSLYIKNPDFSQSLRPSLRDLSELRMKPPDFSRISRSSELHVPNPDFTKAYDKIHDTQRQSPLPPEVNQSNFAEISKKYNYISDLQLKNPLPTTSKTNEPTQSACSSLYIKTPDFTSKLRHKADNESEAVEEPTPHIIHKNMYRPHADSSSKTSVSARSTPTHVEYPQKSEDVTMSLVQHASSQAKLSQPKSSAPPKPPTPVHRVDSRATTNATTATAVAAAAAPQPALPPSSQPHIYSPTPLERPNSQSYYPHPMHQPEKSMSAMHKLYNEEMYQRNLAASPAHHQYSTPSAHVFHHHHQQQQYQQQQQQQQQQHHHHRDVPTATAPSQKMHHAYEQYPQTEKAPMPKSVQPMLDSNLMRPLNDGPMYGRPASTNMMYHEQNRLKPIHSATEVHPTSSSHINTYNYSNAGRPASAHGMNKPTDYYNPMNPMNQMNPPQKWPSQTRITQSPISSAPSPHSISSQNTRISQSQSPVSASPLPYQMHRQSPSNMQYNHSSHTTPSPSPFGYPPSPVPVKPNKLPANTPVNNIPPQKKHNDYALPIANTTDKKQMSNSLTDPKAKLKENSRMHDSREQYQAMQSHHRSSSSSRIGTKTDTKYTDRIDYKRPNTILDPYVFRQASDTDVNYQIIKKTLNKEIPTPSFNRKNADINASLSLSSRINAHAHLTPNTNELNATRKDKSGPDTRLVYLDSKQPHEMYQEKLAKQNELNKLQYPSHTPYHPVQQMENHVNYDSRGTHSASVSNHQYTTTPTQHRHQLPSVGMPQQPKPINQGQTSTTEPNHVPYETPVRQKVEARKEKSTSSTQQQQTQQPPQQQQQQQQQQPTNLSVNDVSSTRSSSATLFGPTKRESPLDLSVKTVKTKADSTGVYDYSIPLRRQDTIPQSLKVDFAPNFSNSSPDQNITVRNNASYRPQSRAETIPGPGAMINNMITNQVNHTQMSSQSPMAQASYSPMELHQRHQHGAPQYNMNVNMDARYKASGMEMNMAYPQSKSRTTPAPMPPQGPTPAQVQGAGPGPKATPTTMTEQQSKARKNEKLPTIFGAKPEELKNFKPDERAYQIEASLKHANESANVAAYNKASGKMNVTPTPKYNPKEKELVYRGNPMHGYPNIQTNPMRHGEYPIANERQSEVIQFVPHQRPQAMNRPAETTTTISTTTTTTTEQHKQQLPYQPYNHFDVAHRAPSQPLFNHSHPTAEYAIPNKMPADRYKMSHQQYMERNDAHYSAATATASATAAAAAAAAATAAASGNVSQKRPSENGLIDAVPMKQPRYDHIDDMKYQQSVNNHHPYYPHQDRNMAMYAPQYMPNMKVNEKAISTPVIVQPQHAIANEAKYHYPRYSNMNNENKHSLPLRPAENYEQSASKVTAPTFRPAQYYPNHYAPVDKVAPYEDVSKAKAQINTTTSHPPHNNLVYTPSYRQNEWPPKTGNNEHPLGYGQRPSSYEHLPTQPNRFESSVIKSPEFAKAETAATTTTTTATAIEPFRTAATTNNNSTSNNNNNVPKAVDQSVISKLRNNLELKEMEKQKLLKIQNNSEKATDDVNKSDLASILAARIRTKGELKGFTPIPVNDTETTVKESPVVVNAVETSIESSEKIVSKAEAKFSDILAGLDLMDWGSTCNDFLEQLQNNSNKQRSKAQRRLKNDENSQLERKAQDSSAASTKSGENSNGEKEKPTNVNKSQSQPQSNNNDETSSDEDKPLLLLRQQSLSENSKNRKNLSSSDREKVSSNRKKTKLEKQSPSKRNENKKRLAIESSSSESEEEVDRYSKRSKKLIRKPRTRSSISNRGDDDDDSDTTGVCTSNKNDKSSKKRNRKEKSSSESDIDANRNSKKRKSLELKSDSDDDDDDDDHDNTALINSPKKRPQPMKVEETMTRSKRKRELEMEIANSKVLRNDKLVKCNSITMEKRNSDNKSSQEKKQNSKLTDEKNNTKNNSENTKAQRSKSSDTKKKTNESDNEVTAKKSGLLKKNLRNTRQSSSSESESSSSSSENESIITERLRSRKPKNNPASDSEANKDSKNEKNKPGCSSSLGGSADEKSGKKCVKNTPKKGVADLDMSEDSRSQFPPGWEEQAYEYKRSLKIPARLITIGRPSWHQHRKSTSLPDLDPQHSSDASETFAEINKKAGGSSAKKGKSGDKKAGDRSASVNHDSDNAVADSKSKSIIDLLHQRVIRPSVKNKKSRNQTGQNEPKMLPQSNEVELLPTPGKDEGKPENVFKSENVFETAVLKSRTRKEYKAMKTQEIIREVFGGEDRPASAPPYNFEIVKQKLLQEQQEQKQQQPQQQQQQQQQQPQQSSATPQEQNESKPLTFDQQYQQYLEKLNVDYGEKIRKVKNLAEAKMSAAESGQLMPKTEKMDEDSLLNQDEESHDTELNECERNIDDSKEGACDSLERGDTPSVMSEADGATPTSFAGVLKTKKGRGNRYGRRKGSSGFDYIRKKKKPLSSQNNSKDTPLIVKRRSAAVNYLEFKNENDITREIRSWVLNKGVGESVLHKAARLGYIDVVAYCLERLEMAPDQKDNAGYTPLHEACSRGLTDIARVLLQYGANHSETAHSGIRPLHEAVDNGYLEIVRLLLSYGADPLLATYAGQTPIMLAEDDDEMVAFLKNHLIDVQNTGPNKMPWKFEGPWKINDPDNIGYDVFDDLPEEIESPQKPNKVVQEACTSTTPEKVVKNPKRKSPLRRKSKQKDAAVETKDEVDESGGTHIGDSDAELFEIEESDAPLIPLYQLRDEGTTKWVLLSDLCYLLKVKSKDTLLKLLYPGSSPSTSANQKDLLRELKMSEFLEKAICLQLLCAGEKLNIRSSKVTLVKYNENVKNALGIKTIKMRL